MEVLRLKNRFYARGISKRKIKFLIIHCFYTLSLIIGISSILFLLFNMALFSDDGIPMKGRSWVQAVIVAPD